MDRTGVEGMNGTGAPGCSIHSYCHGGQTIIEAAGSLTLWNLDALASAMRWGAAGETSHKITVDLRRADSVDSGVLGLLVRESERLSSPAFPLALRVLVMPGKQPDRVLRLGGFDRILDIRHDLEIVQLDADKRAVPGALVVAIGP